MQSLNTKRQFAARRVCVFFFFVVVSKSNFIDFIAAGFRYRVAAIKCLAPLHYSAFVWLSLLFPFATFSFPDSKKIQIYCWIDREHFQRSPALNSRSFGDFLHHNQAALTTRLRSLSEPRLGSTCEVLQ